VNVGMKSGKIMKTVGVFYAWDWLALIGITIVYLLCPRRFIEKKLEYVKFFLFFLCGYFFLFLIVANIVQSRQFTHYLFGVCFALALWFCHLLYPFKETKRNKHLSFFLFMIGFFCFGLQVLIVILHALFGGNM
jgi:hypothetical protein